MTYVTYDMTYVTSGVEGLGCRGQTKGTQVPNELRERVGARPDDEAGGSRGRVALVGIQLDYRSL
eukprot:1536201-Rhodomonas_salina.1